VDRTLEHAKSKLNEAQLRDLESSETNRALCGVRQRSLAHRRVLRTKNAMIEGTPNLQSTCFEFLVHDLAKAKRKTMSRCKEAVLTSQEMHRIYGSCKDNVKQKLPANLICHGKRAKFVMAQQTVMALQHRRAAECNHARLSGEIHKIRVHGHDGPTMC